MQAEQRVKKSKNKKIVMVSASLILVIIFGFVTILILIHTSPSSTPQVHIESKADIQGRARAAFNAGQVDLQKNDFAKAKSDFTLANTLYIKSGDISHRTQIDSILHGIANQEKTVTQPVQADAVQPATH